MKKTTLLLISLLLLAAAEFASAATNYVTTGTNWQAVISASAPGDVIIAQAGVYTDNPVVFSNAITVLCSGTNAPATNILFQGVVQIQGTGIVNFAQCQFLNGATMQIQGSGPASFAQCQFSPVVNIVRAGTHSFSQSSFSSPVNSTNANLLLSQTYQGGSFVANLSAGGGTNFEAYDSSIGTGGNSLFIGGRVLMKRCHTTTLSLSNAMFEGLRHTNDWYVANYRTGVRATASTNSVTPFIAVQCNFAYGVGLNGYKAWLGYNTLGLNSSILLTNCDAVLVGNKLINGGDNDTTPYSLLYCQGGTLKAYNNLFAVSGVNTSVGLHGIWLNSTAAEIANTTVVAAGSFGGSGAPTVYTSGGGGPITIRGCIFSGPDFLIEGDGTVPVNVSYSLVYPYNPGAGAPVGTTFANCFVANPQLSAGYTLNTNSQCIGAGPPDAIYNNRGTTNRNDMGWTGGPLSNTNNFTNSNPMVFFLSGAPQTVFKGLQTNILVNAAAAAGH